MAEEPCQCSDCQRFYKEHDRLIREFPNFKKQQELNWASIQSFRTLCSKVTDELQRQLSDRESKEDKTSEEKHISDIEIADALGDQLYILCGTILRHGMHDIIEDVFTEIQASNMSKLGADGKPIYREDGKVLKGPNYFKPNISKVIDG